MNSVCTCTVEVVREMLWLRHRYPAGDVVCGSSYHLFDGIELAALSWRHKSATHGTVALQQSCSIVSVANLRSSPQLRALRIGGSDLPDSCIISLSYIQEAKPTARIKSELVPSYGGKCDRGDGRPLYGFP